MFTRPSPKGWVLYPLRVMVISQVSHHRGEEILLVDSCYRNRADGTLGSDTVLTTIMLMPKGPQNFWGPQLRKRSDLPLTTLELRRLMVLDLFMHNQGCLLYAAVLEIRK